MSALPVPSAPTPRRSPPQKPERRLRPAPEPTRRSKPRLVYAIVSLAGVALIVVVQLLLSIALAKGAYEIDAYQMQQAELARQEQKLSEDLDRVESPQYLAMNAEALGMVPNANPVYLRLSDGAVLGEPTAATGGAAASAPLVPNSLLDGVPTVTEQTEQHSEHGPNGRTPGGTPTAVPEVPPIPPPPADGLPTPATH